MCLFHAGLVIQEDIAVERHSRCCNRGTIVFPEADPRKQKTKEEEDEKGKKQRRAQGQCWADRKDALGEE